MFLIFLILSWIIVSILHFGSFFGASKLKSYRCFFSSSFACLYKAVKLWTVRISSYEWKVSRSWLTRDPTLTRQISHQIHSILWDWAKLNAFTVHEKFSHTSIIGFTKQNNILGTFLSCHIISYHHSSFHERTNIYFTSGAEQSYYQSGLWLRRLKSE